MTVLAESAGITSAGRVTPSTTATVPGETADAVTTDSVTRCVAQLEGEHRARVRCFTDRGREIDCCGHGLLCCAHVLTAHWRQPGNLLMGSTPLACRREPPLTWVGFPELAAQTVQPAAWMTDLFELPALDYATAGGDNGYLVVRLDDDCELPTLKVPGAILASHTGRAVIVTCRAPTANSPGVDVHFRYFAPQYTDSEDSATGSAMRVLAAYWMHRGLGPELTALQRSPAGGLLHSRCIEGVTWVGGRTELETCGVE